MAIKRLEAPFSSMDRGEGHRCDRILKIKEKTRLPGCGNRTWRLAEADTVNYFHDPAIRQKLMSLRASYDAPSVDARCEPLQRVVGAERLGLPRAAPSPPLSGEPYDLRRHRGA